MPTTAGPTSLPTECVSRVFQDVLFAGLQAGDPGGAHGRLRAGPQHPEHLEFVRGAAKLARQYGALLIFDEVVTGFRIGLSGAQGFFGVDPGPSPMRPATSQALVRSISQRV